MEKLKETWWTNDEFQSKCKKPEDQSDGISISNIGGVFIVIFVGIGMACVTLMFEYYYYKHRKDPKIIDVNEANPTNAKDQPSKLISIFDKHFNKDSQSQKNATLRSRNQPLPSNFRSKY